ncbi:3'-5' exonuclease [Lacticaseibacillus parakribbianus]|uniref:3'-5' exonuclease n=1 Tax=Lacticaseibacillus parakribbianus TaxID=2970927 RepID=UPI0021CB03EF|nr:3'-5' exonuclease [Lacticaseibacillus parakribbianus]
MDFIAMDFETANRKRASACSLALVVVQNSQITDSFYTLIDPEDDFEPMNVQIHHIRPSMVVGQPNFAGVWPHIQSFFTRNRLVVAHNAPFDVSVMRRSLERYHLAVPRYQVIDTAQTSKRLMPELDNRKLDTVSAALHIPLTNHHNALADSYACARILLAQADRFGLAALAPLTKLTAA